ncbi:HipA protein [Limnobacter sp. 130]|uniref:HipA domain-containing protein n=1 Tax=Limnobacter sp. 130 TaxID=2653147 RepID=UPI0012F198FD|nr:HipA domain-containing protein [Limnobacter sp. 130]VWX32748.1 HipA protein [Limnobacter sp. 130]
MAGSEHQTLGLYMGQQHVATVHFEYTRIHRFEYSPEWREQGFALSPHLPLHGPASEKEANLFLRNMFPEGNVFDKALQYLAISKENHFAILGTLGLEAPGSLALAANIEQLQQPAQFQPLDLCELEKRLNENDRNLAVWNGKVHLSAAGVQDKLNVMKHPTQGLGFADGAWASTHLLKFESAKAPGLVVNELFTLQLAKAIGLPVNRAEKIQIGEHSALLVERFDRRFNHNHTEVQRKHTIDGCQLLNRDAMQKYERPLAHGKHTRHIRDGVSFPELFATQQWAKQPAKHTLQLLDWTIFNLLVGNADCHAKNLSFFVDTQGIELSPFYDLVNVLMFDFAHDWAMGLGDEFLDNGNLPSTYDLACFAHACGLPGKLVSQRFAKQIDMLETSAKGVLATLTGLKPFEEQHLQQYLQILERRLIQLKQNSVGIQRAISDLVLR